MRALPQELCAFLIYNPKCIADNLKVEKKNTPTTPFLTPFHFPGSVYVAVFNLLQLISSWDLEKN